MSVQSDIKKLKNNKNKNIGEILMKKIKITMIALLGALMTMTTGCWRPVQKPQIETVEPSETAFLINLDGGTKDQGKFDSVEYLNQSKVAAKRIEIPTRWLKTGRFGHQGEWIRTQRLIKLDRTPVARRWTVEEDTGTSRSKQVLEAESKDSIGVSSGFAITAFIREEDSAKYLYKYRQQSLSTIIDNQVFNAVQAVYSEVSAKYDVTELRVRKSEINDRIREVVIVEFAKDGITIDPNLGLIGGLVYDNGDIQKAIDKVFIAQNIEAQREAERKGQEVENRRLLSIEETEASQRKIKADAEAYEITAKAKAILDGGDSYLKIRLYEVAQLAIEKWGGQVPTTFSSGGSGQFSHLLLNQK